MFKPLRFNDLLKAVPGLAHLQLTPQAAEQTKSTAHVHVEKQIEVEKAHVSGETKETHIHENIKADVSIDSKKGHAEIHEKVTRDIDIKKNVHDTNGSSTTLQHVHITSVDVMAVELTPPHPPREETPMYMRTHRHMVHTNDMPCAICGVRNSTLDDPKENLFHATALETHHYPIERSLLNACDPHKLHAVFPQVKDHATMEAFIDSEENMMVLCDIHHRHPHYGIHHILAQDFFVQPFLFGGYQVVAEPEDVQKQMAANERIIKNHQPKTASH